MFKRIVSLIIVFAMAFQSSGFAQVASQLDISSRVSSGLNSMMSDTFRPLHLRYLSYNPINDNYEILLDKGSLKNFTPNEVKETTKELLKYFLIGVALPDDSFWVNLRPDASSNIIDELLAKTDLGKVLLESDLQLKKDTARYTSPQTQEGKEYWNKLYKKAEELYGTENITIPTLNRPWIVPDEIIVRESAGSAYIYKATLKVMLESDYLKGSQNYNFSDERAKVLNEYSSKLLKETIIPKIAREVNSSKRYADLRQVYYSLILAQWFKKSQNSTSQSQVSKINSKDLTGLTSKTTWSKDAYYQAYRKSFKEGEYNIKTPVMTTQGQVIRNYISGGIVIGPAEIARAIDDGGIIPGGLGYNILERGKNAFAEIASMSAAGDIKVEQLSDVEDLAASNEDNIKFDSGFLEILKKLETPGQISLNSVQNNILARIYYLSNDKEETEAALKIYKRLSLQQKKDLFLAFVNLSNAEVRRVSKRFNISDYKSLSGVRAAIFFKKWKMIEQLSVAELKDRLEKYNYKIDDLSVLHRTYANLLMNYIKGMRINGEDSITPVAKSNNSSWARAAAVVAAAFVAIFASKAMVDQTHKNNQFGEDQGLMKLFEDTSIFGVSADMIIEQSQVWGGGLWESATLQVSQEDVSSFDTLKILVNANRDGKVMVQLLDDFSTDGVRTSLSDVLNVRAGEQTLEIPLSEFSADKSRVREIILHYGREAWQSKLNGPGFQAELKGYEFVNKNPKPQVTQSSGWWGWIFGLTAQTDNLVDAKKTVTNKIALPQSVSNSDSVKISRGEGWASTYIDYTPVRNYSNKKAIAFKLSSSMAGQVVRFQMLDSHTGDNFDTGLTREYRLQKGEQTVYVPINEFGSTDLTDVRRVVVHFGRSVFGHPLTQVTGTVTLKKVETVAGATFMNSIFSKNKFKNSLIPYDVDQSYVTGFGGSDWSSKVIGLPGSDLSDYSYILFDIDGYVTGQKVRFQILGYGQNEDKDYALGPKYTIRKGRKVLRVPIGEFHDAELSNVGRIVIHYGEVAYGVGLNSPEMTSYIELKGVAFEKKDGKLDVLFQDKENKFKNSFLAAFDYLNSINPFIVSASYPEDDFKKGQTHDYVSDDWASSAYDFTSSYKQGIDISNNDYVSVTLYSELDNYNARVELVDTGSGGYWEFGPQYVLKKGYQTINVPLSAYQNVDLKHVSRLVVHWGKEIAGDPLNSVQGTVKIQRVSLPQGAQNKFLNKLMFKPVSGVASQSKYDKPLDYKGVGWASSAVDFSKPKDVSSKAALTVRLSSTVAGQNVRFQIVDSNTNENKNVGVSGVYTLEKGEQTVNIPLSEFYGADLNNVRRVVVHWGNTAFGQSLNSGSGQVTLKSVGFMDSVLNNNFLNSVLNGVNKYNPFVASAATTDKVQTYTGTGWAASVIEFGGKDVSGSDSLKVSVYSASNGAQVRFQLVDSQTDENKEVGVSSVYTLKQGLQTLEIPLSSFSGTDLSSIERAVLHWGASAFSKPLNTQNTKVELKSAQFSTSLKPKASADSFAQSGKSTTPDVSVPLGDGAGKTDFKPGATHDYIGSNWASSAYDFSMPDQGVDASNKEYLTVTLYSQNPGQNVIFQLSSASSTGFGTGAMAEQTYTLKQGTQTLNIPLSEFNNGLLDSSRIVRLVVHWGKEAFLVPLNAEQGKVQIKSVKFSDGGSDKATPKDGFGGINFASMPIVTQAISNLSMQMPRAQLDRLSAIDLDKKISDLQNMVSAGMVPSAERIKEYVQASCLKNDRTSLDKAVLCIADVMRIDEEKGLKTNHMLKDMVLLLESGMETKELKRVLVKTAS